MDGPVPDAGLVFWPGSLRTDPVMLRLLLVLVPVLMTGCASTTQVSTRYLANGAGPQLHHLLVVGRTPEQNLRRLWEDACAGQLKSPALKVTRSHKVLPHWYAPNDDALETWAQQNGADGILIVELTQLRLPSPQMPQADELNEQPGPTEDRIGRPQWSIFFGRHEKNPPPPPTYQNLDMTLYSADGDSLWSGVGRTHEANDVAAIGASQCKAVRKVLASKGLIPKTPK